MSCSRLIVARIVDSIPHKQSFEYHKERSRYGIVNRNESTAVVNTILDKTFDWTSDAAKLSNNNFGDQSKKPQEADESNHSPPTILEEVWKRAKVQMLLNTAAASASLSTLPQKTVSSLNFAFMKSNRSGVWNKIDVDLRSLWTLEQQQQEDDDDDEEDDEDEEESSNGNQEGDEIVKDESDASISQSPVAVFQIHSIQQDDEFGIDVIATVMIAFHGIGNSYGSSSTALFELHLDDEMQNPRTFKSRSDGSSNQQRGISPHLLSSNPDVHSASIELLVEFLDNAKQHSLARNVLFLINHLLFPSNSLVAFNNNTDPWLSLINNNNNSSTPNPSFTSLTEAEIEKLGNGLLLPLASERLGFGSGSTWVSRPLSFPPTVNNTSFSVNSTTSATNKNSSTTTPGNSVSTSPQQQLLFPSVIIVDVLSREVTESGTVIRDCSEVWCDVENISRLPTIVSGSSSYVVHNTNNNNNNNNDSSAAAAAGGIGRRLGIVAMDWGFLESNPHFSELESLEANNNIDFSATTATMLARNASFSSTFSQLTPAQQLAFEWSTLRRNHSSIEENGVTSSLPWSSCPPRAIGPVLLTAADASLRCFTNIHESALTRASEITYSIHPKQVTLLRGLRAIMCDVSPSALTCSSSASNNNSSSSSKAIGIPYNSIVQDDTAAGSGKNTEQGRKNLEDFARIGARWASRRFASATGSSNRKIAENQANSFKKVFNVDPLSAKAYQQGDATPSLAATLPGHILAASMSGNKKQVAVLEEQFALLQPDQLPSFSKIARIVSQQPRCLVAGQDDHLSAGNVGVKSRLLISPQVLKPVVKQLGRRLLVECTFKFVVQFCSPTIVVTNLNSNNSKENNNNNNQSQKGNNSFTNTSFGASNNNNSNNSNQNGFQQQMKVLSESLTAFQISDFSHNFNVNEINERTNAYFSNSGTHNNNQNSANASTSSSDPNHNSVGNKKFCLDHFRVVITGNAYSQHTPPSQNPTARDVNNPCLFHDIQLKSSLNGTNIVAPKVHFVKKVNLASGNSNNNNVDGGEQDVMTNNSETFDDVATAIAAATGKEAGSSILSSSAPSNAKSSMIVWSFPPGTIVNMNEDITLTGKVSLETSWPNDLTAASIAESIRNHNARPFPMPPLHAQLEFVGFCDGDFLSLADDVSLTGSHVDAFTATSVKSAFPSDQLAVNKNQVRTVYSPTITNHELRWRCFNEGLRNSLVLASASNNNSNASVTSPSCLLCATSAELIDNNNSACDDTKNNESNKDSAADDNTNFTAKATKIETLIPDWPSGFSTQHLSATLGSQFSRLVNQGVFNKNHKGAANNANSASGTDYSNIVIPSPKARIIACGPQFGSSYVVWNGRN